MIKEYKTAELVEFEIDDDELIEDPDLMEEGLLDGLVDANISPMDDLFGFNDFPKNPTKKRRDLSRKKRKAKRQSRKKNRRKKKKK